MDLISIVFIFCTLQLLSFVCVCVFIYEDFRVDFGHVLLSGHVPVDKKEQTPKLSYLHTIFKRLRLPKNREKRKRGRRFFDHETTETFDDGTPSIHTDTRHQHHHHGFYYCFKYRSRRGIICESSFSLVFDSSSFFSLSLSLRARMRAVLASRLFAPLFYPFLKKCIITHRRNNNNHNNSEPKLSLARPHRRRALSP